MEIDENELEADGEASIVVDCSLMVCVIDVSLKLVCLLS